MERQPYVFYKSFLKPADLKRTRQYHTRNMLRLVGKPKPFWDRTRAIQRHGQDKQKTKEGITKTNLEQAEDQKGLMKGSHRRKVQF